MDGMDRQRDNCDVSINVSLWSHSCCCCCLVCVSECTYRDKNNNNNSSFYRTSSLLCLSLSFSLRPYNIVKASSSLLFVYISTQLTKVLRCRCQTCTCACVCLYLLLQHKREIMQKTWKRMRKNVHIVKKSFYY